MPRLQRSDAMVMLGLVGLAGLVAGAILGVHYYNTHHGDWRIGVTAVAIAIGVAIGSIIAATFAWYLVEAFLMVVREVFDVIPALGAIGAGAYLLQYHSGGDSVTGTSWFEIIGHGMGIYFIAKGLFIGRSTYLQADSRDKLARLVEVIETADRESPPPTPRETAEA